MFKGNICIHTLIKQWKEKTYVKANDIKKMQQKSGQGKKEPVNGKTTAMKTSWDQQPAASR